MTDREYKKNVTTTLIPNFSERDFPFWHLSKVTMTHGYYSLQQTLSWTNTILYAQSQGSTRLPPHLNFFGTEPTVHTHTVGMLVVHFCCFLLHRLCWASQLLHSKYVWSFCCKWWIKFKVGWHGAEWGLLVSLVHKEKYTKDASIQRLIFAVMTLSLSIFIHSLLEFQAVLMYCLVVWLEMEQNLMLKLPKFYVLSP